MKLWKLFLILLTIWSGSLAIAWLLAPPSYVESSYWSWVFWIWVLLAVGIIRGILAFSSHWPSQDVCEDDDGPSLDLKHQLDITKNF